VYPICATKPYFYLLFAEKQHKSRFCSTKALLNQHVKLTLIVVYCTISVADMKSLRSAENQSPCSIAWAFFMGEIFVLAKQKHCHHSVGTEDFFNETRKVFNNPYMRMFSARLIRRRLMAENVDLEAIPEDIWLSIKWGCREFGINAYDNSVGEPVADIYPISGDAILADRPLTQGIPLRVGADVVAK
jgi:hypothetical protein